MRLKTRWQRWESKHEVELGTIILVSLLLFGIFGFYSLGRSEFEDDLLKDGYNISRDLSKSAGDGRYTIQIWQDGQWSDVSRCGE